MTTAAQEECHLGGSSCSRIFPSYLQLQGPFEVGADHHEAVTVRWMIAEVAECSRQNSSAINSISFRIFIGNFSIGCSIRPNSCRIILQGSPKSVSSLIWVKASGDRKEPNIHMAGDSAGARLEGAGWRGHLRQSTSLVPQQSPSSFWGGMSFQAIGPMFSLPRTK